MSSCELPRYACKVEDVKNQITYGSLCSGYDGIGMGLRLAGVGLKPLFHAEMEPTVAEVLKLEHPEVPNLGDIKVSTWPAGHVDLLSSGDPCQAISIAGRKEGREDPRFLWPWVRQAYRELEPDRILFENVANMISHDSGRTMAERFEHLREDGYAVRWTVLGACAVGAPHHRHRWFALAEWVGGNVPAAVRVGGKTAICGAPRSSGRVLLASPKPTDYNAPGTKRMERGEKPWHDLPTHVALLPTPNARDGGERGSPSPEHAARRAADPLRSLNLEDAAVLLPTPTARDGAGRNEGDAEFWERKWEGQPDRIGKGIPLGAAINLLPTPRATDGTNGGPSQRGSAGDLAMGSACQPQHWGKYTEAVALWESITGTQAPAPTVPGPNGGVRLNPALSEWMMGLRPGLLTDRMNRNAALKAAGNGVVPQQAAAAWDLLTN
jgi:DNA (cytosine-5)-methyltransferase 1